MPFTYNRVCMTHAHFVTQVWRQSPLDVLLPLATGMALVHFCVAAFVLWSYNHFFLICFIVTASIVLLQVSVFLYRLYMNDKRGVPQTITTAEIQRLLSSLCISTIFYTVIAPTHTWVVLFTVLSFAYALLLLCIIYKLSPYTFSLPRIQSTQREHGVLLPTP